MQTQGSLQESDLASLLQTMQSERATGTVTIEAEGGNCSLYFLFGHLFHAVDGTRTGSDVVIDALGWSSGTFQFDPRAKLPAEETITTAPSDLIAAAQERRQTAPVAAAPEPPTEVGEPIPEEPAAPEPAPQADEWAAQPAAESIWETAPMEVSTPQAEEAAAEAPVTQPEAGAPAPEEAAVAGEVTEAPASEAATPEPEPAVEVEVVAARAETKSGKSKRDTVAASAPVETANPAHEPPSVLYPLPAGKPIYEHLASSFVDFPKLLRTLNGDQTTGYVHLGDTDFGGTLVLHSGEIVEALVDGLLGDDVERAAR